MSSACRYSAGKSRPPIPIAFVTVSENPDQPPVFERLDDRRCAGVVGDGASALRYLADPLQRGNRIFFKWLRIETAAEFLRSAQEFVELRADRRRMAPEPLQMRRQELQIKQNGSRWRACGSPDEQGHTARPKAGLKTCFRRRMLRPRQCRTIRRQLSRCGGISMECANPCSCKDWHDSMMARLIQVSGRSAQALITAVKIRVERCREAAGSDVSSQPSGDAELFERQHAALRRQHPHNTFRFAFAGHGEIAQSVGRKNCPAGYQFPC